MANISLVKPDMLLFSKAVDCVVEYLKNKEYKINGGNLIETMSYSEWLNYIVNSSDGFYSNMLKSSVYFIFCDDLLIGFVEFKSGNNLNMETCFSIRPSERVNNYYSDLIEVLKSKSKELGYSTMLLASSVDDSNFVNYAKSNLSNSVHLDDTDILYFKLQLV